MFLIQTFPLVLGKELGGREREVYLIIKQSCHRCHRWWNLAIVRVISTLLVLSWGAVSLVKMFSISPVLPGFQVDCKVTAGENGSKRRTQIQNGDRDIKLFFCFSLIHGPP
jgi:hypothetical protein